MIKMIEIMVAIKICLKTKFRIVDNGIDVLSKGIDSIEWCSAFQARRPSA